MGSSSPASAEPEADVLVVGAGPAGSATAALLAAQGHRVLVAERSAFPRDKACSEYMSPETVRMLDRLDALGALERSGAVAVAGTSVTAIRGNALEGRFAGAPTPPWRPTGLAVARRVLDSILMDVARNAGATVLERTTFESLMRDDDGRVVGAMVRDRSGKQCEVRAQLTVGADGLRSRVARALGPRRYGWPRRLAFVAHVRDVADLQDVAELHVGGAGYVGLNPIGHGIANVALVVPARAGERATGRVADFFFESLEHYPGVRGRVPRAALVRDVLVTGPFAARTARVTVPGALLVGDAAEFFDPFTGEGICSALRGAELVAETVGDCIGDRAALDRALFQYRRERRRHFGGRRIVERLIGWSMEWPTWFDRAVERIGRRPGMADTLVGVTGACIPARYVLNPSFLLRMVL